MLKKLIPISILLILFFLGGVYWTGSELTKPAHQMVGNAPKELNALNVEFNGTAGWYADAGDDAPCLLLMHSVRSNRTEMIERGILLNEAGYSVLLIDLQAHGESPGDRITFGFLESDNAHAAVSYLRHQKKCSEIAVIGRSLGGAAALLGDDPIEADILVLESVYTTIDKALDNRLRMRFGRLGSFLSPLFTVQLKYRAGVSRESLRPIDQISKFDNPVLIIAGTDDKHTTIEESVDLYSAANTPRYFLEIEGAEHVDFYRHSPEKYREGLLGFLEKYLGEGRISASE